MKKITKLQNLSNDEVQEYFIKKLTSENKKKLEDNSITTWMGKRTLLAWMNHGRAVFCLKDKVKRNAKHVKKRMSSVIPDSKNEYLEKERILTNEQ